MLTLTISVDCTWITGYVPNLVIELTEGKNKAYVRPGSSVKRPVKPMNIFMFFDDSSFEVSLLEHLVATQDKFINSLYVNVFWCLDISKKSHCSRLYNSVNSQPILDYSMSNFRSRHLLSLNNKFKPVSEINSIFFNLDN